MLIFRSESRGNTVEKAKGSMSHHEQVWFPSSPDKAPGLLMLHFEVLNLNNSLNIKIRKTLKGLFGSLQHNYYQLQSSSVFCPRAGPSLQIQAPRLQFCPKAGLPLQTQEPRLQFYQGWIGAVASRCFLHPTLSLASERTLKDLKRSQGHQRGGEESGFG